MNGNGVQAIATLAQAAKREPKVLAIGGREVIAVPVGESAWEIEKDHEQLDPPDPAIPALLIHTLEGFTEYVRRSVEPTPKPAAAGAATPAAAATVADDPGATVVLDQLDVTTLAVHVVNERDVRLITKLEGDRPQRQVIVVAGFESLIGNASSTFAFGQFLDLERFSIGLQALFVDTADRAAVLKVIGNIRDEKVATTADDGISQAVTLKAGIVRNSEAVVPNPVTLAPFRTFREVTQPESKFVLRLKPGAEGQLPTAALFEADGGAWRLEAIRNIRWYLAGRLPAELTLLA
jgi:hypothetical protein